MGIILLADFRGLHLIMSNVGKSHISHWSLGQPQARICLKLGMFKHIYSKAFMVSILVHA